jgi:hypothetical protein
MQVRQRQLWGHSKYRGSLMSLFHPLDEFPCLLVRLRIQPSDALRQSPLQLCFRFSHAPTLTGTLTKWMPPETPTRHHTSASTSPPKQRLCSFTTKLAGLLSPLLLTRVAPAPELPHDCRCTLLTPTLLTTTHCSPNNDCAPSSAQLVALTDPAPLIDLDELLFRGWMLQHLLHSDCPRWLVRSLGSARPAPLRASDTCPSLCPVYDLADSFFCEKCHLMHITKHQVIAKLRERSHTHFLRRHASTTCHETNF